MPNDLLDTNTDVSKMSDEDLIKGFESTREERKPVAQDISKMSDEDLIKGFESTREERKPVAQDVSKMSDEDLIKGFEGRQIPKPSESLYELREDGTPKGKGYFGELARPDGKVSTELSIGVNLNDKETQIPALVPTLTKKEIDYLTGGGEVTPEIKQKAVDFATQRISQGKSPFAHPDEEGKSVPAAEPSFVQTAGKDIKDFGQALWLGTRQSIAALGNEEANVISALGVIPNLAIDAIYKGAVKYYGSEEEAAKNGFYSSKDALTVKLSDYYRNAAKSVAPTNDEILAHNTLIGQIAQGAGAAPLTIASYVAAAETFGLMGATKAVASIMSMPVVDAIQETDKGLWPTVEAGITGLAFGGLLHLTGPLKFWYRAFLNSVPSAGLTYFKTHGDWTQTAATAFVMFGMSIPGGYEAHPRLSYIDEAIDARAKQRNGEALNQKEKDIVSNIENLSLKEKLGSRETPEMGITPKETEFLKALDEKEKDIQAGKLKTGEASGFSKIDAVASMAKDVLTGDKEKLNAFIKNINRIEAEDSAAANKLVTEAAGIFKNMAMNVQIKPEDIESFATKYFKNSDLITKILNDTAASVRTEKEKGGEIVDRVNQEGVYGGKLKGEEPGRSIPEEKPSGEATGAGRNVQGNEEQAKVLTEKLSAVAIKRQKEIVVINEKVKNLQLELQDYATDSPVRKKILNQIDRLAKTRDTANKILQKEIAKAQQKAKPMPKTKGTVYPLDETKKAAIQNIKTDLELGEAPQLVKKTTEQGIEYLRTKSTNPDYFVKLGKQYKGGMKKAYVKNILDKAINGEPLTENQTRILDTLLDAKTTQIDNERYYYQQQLPKVPVVELNLKKGDEFTILGEKYKVTDIDKDGNYTIKDSQTYTVEPFDKIPKPDKGSIVSKTEAIPPVTSEVKPQISETLQEAGAKFVGELVKATGISTEDARIVDSVLIDSFAKVIGISRSELESSINIKRGEPPKEDNVLFQEKYARPFYSKIEDVVGEWKQSKYTPEQLMKYISGHGIKDADIEVTKLRKFLAGKKIVSKTDLIKYLQENQVNLTVKELGKEAPQDIAKEFYDKKERAYKLIEKNNYTIAEISKDIGVPLYEHTGDIHEDVLGSLEAYYKVYGDITKDYAFDKEGNAVEKYTGVSYPLQFSNVGNYVQAGGKDHRELLIKVPDKAVWGVKPFINMAHYPDDENILAHIRVSTRTDSSGKKMLFIEELQSDWNLAERKYGSVVSANQHRFFTNQAIDLYKKVNKTPEEIKEYNKLRDRVAKDYPYTFLLNSWKEIALKQLVRYAAENGIDRIGWANGDMIKNMYDLKLEKLEWGKNIHGNYEVIVKPHGQEEYIFHSDEDKLEDYLGKSIAEKIISSEENKGSLSGDDLKAKGEWADKLYNEMIPRIFEKDIGKEYEAKTGKTGIETSKGNLESIQLFDIPKELHDKALYKGQYLLQKNRAAVQFAEDGKAIIHILEKGDRSSIFHEMFHVYNETLSRLNHPDLKIIEDWIGKKYDVFNKDDKERFAKAGERYFREGKAPTVALRDVFEKIKAWFTEIYKKINTGQLGVKLSPEIRTMFDRWFGGEKEMPEISKTAEQPTKTGIKEPWQMTKAEFYKKYGSDTNFAKFDPSDLTDKEYELHKEAKRLAKTPSLEVLPRLDRAKDKNKAIYHESIITNALSEGKPVPQEVLEDYPELQIKPEIKEPTKTGQVPLVSKGEKVNLKPQIEGILENPAQKDMFKTVNLETLGFQTLYEKISDLFRDGKVVNAFDHLVDTTREFFKQGITNYDGFVGTMKRFLGNMYDTFKGMMNHIYKAAKASPIKGFAEFAKQDIYEPAKALGIGAAGFLKSVRNTLSPMSASPEAKRAGLIIAEQGSGFARAMDKAHNAVKEMWKVLNGLGKDVGNEFIDAVQNNRQVEHTDPATKVKLNLYKNVVRRILDDTRDEVRKLGTGALEKFDKDYFPQRWKNPEKAAAVLKAWNTAGSKLTGSKQFLKEKKIPTHKEGLERGLEPLYDNPIDTLLHVAREENKYIMGSKIIEALRKEGLTQFVRIGADSGGLSKLNDSFFTAYGNPNIRIKEAYDKSIIDGLTKTMEDLGIQHERKVSIGGKGRWGYTNKEGNFITTKFAGAEGTLIHEIGHALDIKYELKEKFLDNPFYKNELRKLADQYYASNANVSSYFKKYVRQGEEKMAAMLHAYVHAPEMFKKIAPHTFSYFDEFIKSKEELKQIADIKHGTEMGVSTSTMRVGGLIINGQYMAPEGAARIINNYLSPGLRGNIAFRSGMAVSNLLNSFQLGMSFFHLGFTSLDAAISNGALGLIQVMNGDIAEGAKTLAMAPISPLTTFMRGRRGFREWDMPGSTTPEMKKLIDTLQGGGYRARQDKLYQTQVAQNMIKAFHSGNILGGIVRSPFAAVEQAARPLMEYLVPRQKMGVAMALADYELKRNPNMPHEELRNTMFKIAASVDNRMGQLAYDNLFWNKIIKDLLMISVRSVGWNVGTFREILGGAYDMKDFVKNKELSYRLSYTFMMPVVVGTLGAVYQYLATGERPKETKDFFFPKTGILDEEERPQRVSFPSYMKDLYHYYQNPVKTLLNKTNPGLNIVLKMLQNEDFYGTEIRHPDDKLTMQAKELMGYMLKEFEPFSYRGIQREVGLSGKVSAKSLAPMIGITPAPVDINKTPAELLEYNIEKGHLPSEPRTTKQSEQHQLEAKIRKDIAKHDYSSLHDALRNRDISFKESEKLIKTARQTKLQRRFGNLNAEESIEVWNKMNPVEKQGLRSQYVQKVQRKVNRTLKREDIKNLVEKFHESLK